MCHRRSHAIASNARLWTIGLAVAAATWGCGFLDEDLHKTEAEFEASFALEGSGASGRGCGAGRGFGCGVGAVSGSSSVRSRAAIPPRLPREPRALGAWYRRHCRGTRAAMCRLVLRQLRMKRGASYAALAERESADEEDEDRPREGDEPETEADDEENFRVNRREEWNDED